MTVQELTHTIQAQDVTSLTKIPGVGKKTAERLILWDSFRIIRVHAGDDEENTYS